MKGLRNDGMSYDEMTRHKGTHMVMVPEENTAYVRSMADCLFCQYHT